VSAQPWRIAVVAGKGGVGKTTSVINLGAGLARLGRRCLVVDCDPQSNLTSGLGFDPYEKRTTVVDVITGRCTAARAIVETSTPGLDLIPAHPDLTSVEGELRNQIGSVLRLRDALESMPEGSYDAILFDTPPNFQFHTISVLAAAHHVLVPLQMSAFALRGLKEVIRVIGAARRGLNADLTLLGVAPTFVSHTRFSRDLLDALAESRSVRLFDSTIAMTVRLQESALQGVPVFVSAPSSSAARDYAALTAEIVVALQDAAEEVPAPALERAWRPEATAAFGSQTAAAPAATAVLDREEEGEEAVPAMTASVAVDLDLDVDLDAEIDTQSDSDVDWKLLLESVRDAPAAAAPRRRFRLFGRRLQPA
jgi:chromosome partitioning protein